MVRVRKMASRMAGLTLGLAAMCAMLILFHGSALGHMRYWLVRCQATIFAKLDLPEGGDALTHLDTFTIPTLTVPSFGHHQMGVVYWAAIGGLEAALAAVSGLALYYWVCLRSLFRARCAFCGCVVEGVTEPRCPACGRCF
jgi:hypothetical protein